MMKDELGIEYSNFIPISCIPKNKVSKRDLKDYPFIPELQAITLDVLGETLINLIYSNFKSGGLNTQQMNLILKEDTIKDIMLLYNNAEANIHTNLTHILTRSNNKFDILIDETLEELMKKDKEWEKGTMRVHKDKY